MNEKHLGSEFDDSLQEEGLLEEVEGVGLKEGFFEEVVGGWRGEPLERAPQLEYEQRARL